MWGCPLGNFISNIYKTKIGRTLLRRTFIVSVIYLIFLIGFTVFFNQKSHQIYRDNQNLEELKSNLQSMVQALIDQETGQRGYNLTAEKTFLTPYNNGTKSFKELSVVVKNQSQTFPNLQTCIKEMIRKGNYWHSYYGEPQVQANMKGMQVSNQWLLDGKNNFDSFRAASNKAIRATSAFEQKQAIDFQKLIYLYHLILIVVSILLIGLLLFFILRSFERLSHPLTEVHHAIKELAKGNFDYPLPIVNRQHDELTELVNSLQVMRYKMQWTFNQTKHQAEIDALTNIYNRGSFDRQLEVLLNELEHPESAFGLILFDLDHFKQFNDTYGHTEGDRLLQYVASLITHELKGNDFLARYGGEEFVVLTNADSTVGLAEHLRCAIEENPLSNYKLTASFGVTLAQNGDSAKMLIDRADRALYSAKRNGRNQVGVLDSQMNKEHG